METMKGELEAAGHELNVVAINIMGGDGWIHLLTSRCSFDVLQDLPSVDAWGQMGGHVNDFFIYRKGGRLAPGGYLSSTGALNTNLATGDGYNNVYAAIVEADGLGPADACGQEPPEGGLQLPGNLNQDDSLDMSDAISLLGYLFLGAEKPLPCGGASLDGAGNRTLMDVNDDVRVNLSDAVHILNFLFGGGPPPVLGTDCILIAGCPAACPG